MFLEPHFYGKRGGWIEVICGSMFSGKTEELIRRLKRAKIADQKVEIFKPKIDTRYDDLNVVSHDSNAILATPAESAQRILKISNDTTVVGIDEAPANYASLFIQNLVNSDLNVQYDLSSAAQVSVILFNSLGQFEKILFTGNEPVGTHQHAFNVKNLHPGLYFVQFISGNSRHTEKIIVE